MIEAFFNSNDILALFTDRSGGVSKPPYDSLNVAFHVGDKVADVIKNRSILADNLNINIKNLIYMDQIHSNFIKIVNNSLINKNENCDALITDKKEIALMVMVADCIPILMYDNTKRVVAAIHAGRNGTFQEIAKKSVLKMQEAFGVNTKDILVSFGPSIHKCCYEVSKDLADFAIKSFGTQYVDIRNKHFFIDLQTLNFDQLISAGIDKKNIEISPICTSCDKRYFSYRRDKTTGRFAGVIMLRGSNDR